MAFPFVFESNFEQGTNAEWTSETDVAGILNYRHYTWLGRYQPDKVGPIAPWRGAYVAEWDLVGDTSDHTLISSSIVIADTTTLWMRMLLFLGKDLTGATDVFNIYEHQGTANAVEAAVGLRITTGAATVEIGIGQTSPTAYATQKLEKGKYYTVELATVVQSGGTGTSDLYVDGSLVASITGITNTAVLRGVLGTQDTLSTTLGHIFVSEVAFDELRIYPHRTRFPVSVQLTKSSHVFVGPGWIDSTALLSSAGTVVLYDTDTANTHNAEGSIELDSTRSIVGYDGGAYFERGCYAVLGATTRAEVKVGTSNITTQSLGPITYGSVGALRQYAHKRSVRPQNV